MIQSRSRSRIRRLWVACSNIQTIGKADEWGMGALGFTFVTPEAARAWVHVYNNPNNAQKLADYPSNPNVAMVSGFMCAPTDAEAEIRRPAGRSSSSRFVVLWSKGRRRAGHVQSVGGVPELEGRAGGTLGARLGPDRLAGRSVASCASFSRAASIR